MSAGRLPDDELEALVGDALHQPEIDPAFMAALRARVVEERGRVIEEAARRPPSRLPWRRIGRPRWSRPAVLAGGFAAAAAAVALLVTILVPRAVQPAPVRVTATAAVAGLASVAASSPVVVHFDLPVDRQAVVSAMRISPATAVRTVWRGQDLVVTPLHGLAPNEPYVVTFDRARARTAGGAAFADDLHVVFGTAPAPAAGGAHPTPTALPLRLVTAAAADGSEAVVASDGSVIATSATAGAQNGLLRVLPDGSVQRLAAATDAICVSRSGRSLAYLVGGGEEATIVMAGGDGSGGRSVSASVDAGSPLGWIGDDRVSFVSGGRLRAIDRSGTVTDLSAVAVDAAHDTVAISPGGRYAFLRPGSAGPAPGQGMLVDLVSGLSHPLPGIVGDPAFTADGASVVWVDGSGATPLLARAPSAGGPVLTLRLPLAAGDAVSDLGVAPSGARLIYSVRHASGDSELRVAAIDDGATQAVAPDLVGGSPNWAAGNRIAVLGQPAGGIPRIELVTVPAPSDPGDAVQGLADAFANAQVGGDRDAMASLAAAGVAVDRLPRVSRASVVAVTTAADGTMQVRLRLVADATVSDPVAREAVETLRVRPGDGGRLQVAGADAGPLAPVTPGPHVVAAGAGDRQGTVAVTFDSDLDPASVAGALGLRTASGGPVGGLRNAYDAGSRTVTLSSPAGITGSLVVSVGTGLRDVAGRHAAGRQDVPFSL